MKLLIILTVFFSIAANSQEAIVSNRTLLCTPATKFNPFESMKIVIKDNKAIVDIKFSRDAGYSPDEEGYQIKCKSQYTGDGCAVTSLVGDNDFEGSFKLDIDINDWAGAYMEFNEDDEGASAFVKFLSDGPTIMSMYRCK